MVAGWRDVVDVELRVPADGGEEPLVWVGGVQCSFYAVSFMVCSAHRWIPAVWCVQKDPPGLHTN